MHKDKKFTGEEMDVFLGGYVWYVESAPRDKDGMELTTGVMKEAFANEQQALNCFKVRVEEGYRSTVFRYVALSAF
jgi:hypothetical protein